MLIETLIASDRQNGRAKIVHDSKILYYCYYICVKGISSRVFQDMYNDS